VDAGEKKERLMEAASALLEGAPNRELKITLLNKGLFYLDLISLRDRGTPVTFSAYIALNQGPVVADFPKKLVKELENRGLATQSNVGDAKPVRLLKDPPAFRFLDAGTVELAKEIGQEVASKTSAAMSMFSHDNPGWVAAYAAGCGRGTSPKSIDMLIALQQEDLLEDDPWLSDPPDEKTKTAILASQNLAGESF
jgi:hypothetical protein